MNAYLKLICLTLGSPFSLHHVKENDYLITAGYIFTLTKTEPINVTTLFLHFVLRKSVFKSKKSLSLCLGVTLPLYLYLRIFHCQTNFPNFRSASNQNNSRSFPLFVFRKTSNIKTDYKAVYKISTCKFLSLEILENKYTFGF